MYRDQSLQSFQFEAAASKADLFPLFGPVRETEWLPEWKPHFVYPPQGSNDAPGTVFITPGYTPGSRRVWVMVQHDPIQGLAQYVVTQQDHSTAEIRVQVDSLNSSNSRITVSYRRTALVPEADEFVQDFTKSFASQREVWKSAIDRWIQSRAA